MTKDQIVTAAVDSIQDGAYGETEVAELLDQVATMVNAHVRIPSAKSLGTFTVSTGNTSTNILAAVVGFSASYIATARNVTEGKDLKIYPTLELLFADYGDFDDVGPVEAICLEDFMAWTQKVPAADQVISFIYYRTPTIPVSGELTWAPAGLHRDLFVHGCVAIAYGELEDGMEDGKPNTGYNAGKFYRALTDLQEYYGRQRKHFASGFWNV